MPQAQSTTAKEFSRQAFEDAQFARNQASKRQMLEEINEAETKYDSLFSGVIFLNLIFMGIETDYGDRDKTTGPFLIVESVFILLYLLEFVLRIRAINAPIEDEEVREREERIRAQRREANRSTAVQIASQGLSNMVQRGAKFVHTNTRGSEQQIAPSPDGDEPAKKEGINGDGHANDQGRAVDGMNMEEAHYSADDANHDDALALQKPKPVEAQPKKRACSIFWDPNVSGVRHWLVFDFLIVVVSILDAWVLNILLSGSSPSNSSWKGGSQGFRSLKILRILRVLRSVKLLRYVKDLYLLMNGFVYAFRTLGWVLFLLVLFNYVCALFAVRMFREGESIRYFGDLSSSMYYLFVVLTLEKWPDIADSGGGDGMNWRWMFFVVYILVSHFMILNLFVAVIVENVTKASATADVTFLKELQDKRRDMMKHLLDLFEAADTDQSGTLTTEEFNAAMERGDGEKALDALEIQRNDIEWLFDVLDVDGDNELSVDEFMEGMMALKASEISRHMFQLQYSVVKELKKLEATIMRENPTAARTVVGEKKKMQRVKTQNETGEDPLSPALLQPLDEANSWCLALKSTMETFASNVREVQSLAREASRDSSSVESSDEDLAKLAQDLEARLDLASSELEFAKSEADKLYASSFLRTPDGSPDSGGDNALPDSVPGSIPTTPPRNLTGQPL